MLTVKQMTGNSRQVPRDAEILSNKQYHDILYSWLQCNSTKIDAGNGLIKRYVPKKLIRFNHLGELLGLTRQTVSTKFKKLIELGLVIPVGNTDYEIIELPKEKGMILPYKTLKVLVDALNEKSISTYTYLLNRYLANKQMPFTFTLAQVKTVIGLSVESRHNNEVVINILDILQRIGLLKFHKDTINQEDNFKTLYSIDWMTNELK